MLMYKREGSFTWMESGSIPDETSADLGYQLAVNTERCVWSPMAPTKTVEFDGLAL